MLTIQMTDAVKEAGIYKCQKALVAFFLEKVPKALRDRMADEGWKIVISDTFAEDHKNNEWVDTALAYTKFSTKTIDIRPQKITGILGKDPDSIIHECGHVMDKICGDVSQTDEFKKLYELESDRFRKTFEEAINMTTPREYFAEAFSAIVLSAKKMTSNCPKTTNYINTLIASL